MHHILFSIKTVFTLIVYSCLLSTSVFALVSLDELVDPNSGNRVVIFGEFHTAEMTQMATDKNLTPHISKFFDNLSGVNATEQKKGLVLVELMDSAEYAVSPIIQGIFSSHADEWFKSGKVASEIEVRKGDIRTEITTVFDNYFHIFEVGEFYQSPIVTKETFLELYPEFIDLLDRTYSGRLNEIFKTKTAIAHFDSHLSTVTNFRAILEEKALPIPAFFSELEDNLNLLLTALKDSDQEFSLSPIIEMLFDVKRKKEMTLDEIKIAFDEFFNKSIDFSYADAGFYFNITMDQEGAQNRTTFLMVGDSHRAKMTENLLSKGYKLEDSNQSFPGSDDFARLGL